MKNAMKKIAILTMALILIISTGQNVLAAQTDPSDASLKKLVVTPGELTPEFNSDVTEYTLSVDATVDRIGVTAVPTSSTAKIAAPTGTSNLKEGKNTAVITVEASDGSTQEYTIIVTRGAGDTDTTDTATETDTETETDTNTDTDTTTDTDGNADTEPIEGDYQFQIQEWNFVIIAGETTEEDMPKGFKLEDTTVAGVNMPAGVTDNSNMVLFVAREVKTRYKYRFIYDPEHDAICPYYGTEFYEGYAYTVPDYEGALVPDGFETVETMVENVPTTALRRIDSDITSEEIQMGLFEETDFLIFRMMNQEGKEVFYTYSMIERNFLNSAIQMKDAESINDLEDQLTKSSEDNATLNRVNTARMNTRLAIIVVLIVIILILAGMLISTRVSGTKTKDFFEEEDEDDEEDDDAEMSNVIFTRKGPDKPAGMPSVKEEPVKEEPVKEKLFNVESIKEDELSEDEDLEEEVNIDFGSDSKVKSYDDSLDYEDEVYLKLNNSMSGNSDAKDKLSESKKKGSSKKPEEEDDDLELIDLDDL